MKKIFLLFYSKKIQYLLFFLFFFVAISIPLISMMIKLGVGVKGSLPTSLPFKFTEIMTIFFKTFLLIILGVLYLSTKRRTLLPLLMLSIFAINGGLHYGSNTLVMST